MDWIVILLAAVLGGLWRRWFGGWPTEGRRWVQLSLGASLGAVLALGAGAPWWAAVLSAAAVAFWVPGHRLMEWRLGQWLLRYGPLGIYWWLARKYLDRYGAAVYPAQWASPFIDGPFALAEILGGATFYAAMAWLLMAWPA